ncbi:MAG: hypothetical protein AMQ22_01926 [Candidatus Methanofastidiosum methylothiophilum]|uniref:Archaeal holliday junction resolvase (Hjc) n=1 Tax=Candidatus Methanofastidiosum methylothiophilum TaxID=1705564 RepID=A0A150ISX1_9EURY|nr:MAG: hypothetical protein AMQ22_01926 [Candidatus Methanofastidiosum methylthiophilus]
MKKVVVESLILIRRGINSMTNRQKQKGSKFERDMTIELNKLIERGKFKKVPASGAMGTALQEGLLCGDIVGDVQYFPKKFRLEAKTGYMKENKDGKYFHLRKEWLDKIKMEALQTNSFPALIAHFENAKSGVKNFVVLDIEEFAWLINEITRIQRDISEDILLSD